MSTQLFGAGSRMPRIAEAAVERARLTVVPRDRRRRTPRVPFVALLSLLLVGGVAGLLLLNTTMQQVSFTATSLEARATSLEAQRQGLQMDVDSLRDPQRVAVQARRMGMVPEDTPAFIRLGDGTVLGKPVPATGADAVRLVPFPTLKPKDLRGRTIRVIEKNPHARGAASPDALTATGTKNSQNR